MREQIEQFDSDDQSEDHKKHLVAAWRAAAEAAKQLERLREQMVLIDRHDKAEEAGGAAECCREWRRGIYEEIERTKDKGTTT